MTRNLRTEMFSAEKMFFSLCKAVDTAISLGAWLRFKHDQRALAEFKVNPRDYLDPIAFEKDYLITSFLRKWVGLNTGIDLEAVALESFAANEETCRQSNLRIRRSRNSPIKENLASYLYDAKRKIALLLGPFSLFKVDGLEGWGPGATVEIPRRRAFLDTKYHEVPFSVSARCASLAADVMSRDLHWSGLILGVPEGDILGPFCFTRSVFDIQECEKIDMAPKDATTHRVIGVPLRLNGFLQKGVGQFMRRRLRSHGIDLNDQGPNQRAARAAYFEGLATLDLKSASDTVAKELVFELLPPDWADYLNALRSHSARLPDGTVVRLEKFSAMGNGFTFELESLIFWALAEAVRSRNGGDTVLVYGDDIIVDRSNAHELIELLEWCGFAVNPVKSYIDGNFFESCGKHFFKGVEVTPIFQKSLIDSEPEKIRLANRLLRYAERTAQGDRLNPAIRPAWSYCYQHGLSSRSHQLPLGAEGDDAWLVPADFFNSRYIRFDLNFGYQVRVWRLARHGFPANDRAVLAHWLRLSHGSGDSDSLRHLDERAAIWTPEGCLERDGVTLESRSRWVMPTGDFGLSW